MFWSSAEMFSSFFCKQYMDPDQTDPIEAVWDLVPHSLPHSYISQISSPTGNDHLHENQHTV